MTKGYTKKVLIVDFTDMEKVRYIIPTVELNTQKPNRYLTTYQKIDIAVGFKSYEELLQEKVITNINGEYNYDYIFFNVDSAKSLSTIPIEQEDQVFLMTSFDIYSIEKAVECFKCYKNDNVINKIILANTITNNHNSYLEYLFSNTGVSLSGKTINFPYDNGDLTIIFENQRAGRLELKPFSKKFKTALMELVKEIGNENTENMQKYMKELEKV